MERASRRYENIHRVRGFAEWMENLITNIKRIDELRFDGAVEERDKDEKIKKQNMENKRKKKNQFVYSFLFYLFKKIIWCFMSNIQI